MITRKGGSRIGQKLITKYVHAPSSETSGTSAYLEVCQQPKTGLKSKAFSLERPLTLCDLGWGGINELGG